MARKRSAPKPKTVPYLFLPPTDKDGNLPEPYALIEELVGKFHPHLALARICVVWRTGMKADKDGLLTLGKCKKASDLDRELKDWDFVIVLNDTAWADLDPQQRRALVDHELCHAQIATDEDGEEKADARGRLVYRLRKHDIEEFRCVVERHGCYKADLEAFVAAARRKRKEPLFAEQEA